MKNDTIQMEKIKNKSAAFDLPNAVAVLILIWKA